MRKDYRLSLSESKLVLQLLNPLDFDLSVFSDQPEDLYAGYSRIDDKQGTVEYPIEDLISLRELLAQIKLGRMESCSLLYSVLGALKMGMKNQPVVLDLNGIFLSCRADAICLIRAPLILERWMKRQDDLDYFLDQLLNHLNCDCFDVCGLLWKAKKESRSLEAILADLENLVHAAGRKRLFRRKAVEPFSLKKPLYPDFSLRSKTQERTAGDLEKKSGWLKVQEDIDSGFVQAVTENKSEESFAGHWQGGQAFWQHDPSCLPDSLWQNEPVQMTESVPASFSRQNLSSHSDRPGDLGFDLPENRDWGSLDFFESGSLDQNDGAASDPEKISHPQLPGSSEWEVFRRTNPGFENLAEPDDLENLKQDSPAAAKKEPVQPELNNRSLGLLSTEDQICQASPPKTKTHRLVQADFEQNIRPASTLEKSLLDMSASGGRKALAGYEPTMLMDSLFSPAFLECQGKRMALEGSDLLVGRAADCQVRLEGQGVSAHHARLICQADRWYIQDLKSTNGTYIGQKRIVRRMRLKEGMTIRFGNLEAAFFEQQVLHS